MKKTLIALVAVFALGTTVFAGEFKKDLNIMIGYASPSGDAGDAMDPALALGLGWDGYKINDTFMLGAEFIYTAQSGEWPANTTVDWDLTTTGFLPYVKAGKDMDIAGKTANLYGLLGLGFYSIKSELTNAAGTSASGTSSETGFHLGGGIMFPLKDNMKLGLDLRYHIVASDYSLFVPAAKFTYSF